VDPDEVARRRLPSALEDRVRRRDEAERQEQLERVRRDVAGVDAGHGRRLKFRRPPRDAAVHAHVQRLDAGRVAHEQYLARPQVGEREREDPVEAAE